MIVKSFVAGALLLAASAAIAAAPTQQPAPEGATATDAAPEKKICRTERTTGSLTRRTRICMTAAQWRDVNNRTRRGVDEMTSSASGAQSCKYEDPNGPPCY